jgi:hypothetical protein
MRYACLILCVLAAGALTGCNAREVDTLSGVASVKTLGDSIIRVRDIPNDAKAEGAGMELRTAYDKPVGELRLNEGDSFHISDGRHASYHYKFVRIEDGFVFFRRTERVDERSAGGKLEETISSVKVRPYPSP